MRIARGATAAIAAILVVAGVGAGVSNRQPERRFHSPVLMRPRATVLFGAPAISAPALQPSPGEDRPVDPAPGNRNEPSVAVNPLDPRMVLVAEHNFNFLGGAISSGVQVTAYLSIDGGTTFRRTGDMTDGGPLTHDGGRHSVDPSAAYDSKGRAFVGYLAGDSTEGGFYVSRSSDGGRTWQGRAPVAEELHTDDTCTFQDKSYITTGRPPRNVPRRYSRRDWVYASWNEITAGVDNGSCMYNDIQDVRVSVARSSDGGKTFSKPRDVGQRGSYASIPKVGPDGTLFVSFLRSAPAPPGCPWYGLDVLVAMSRDGGKTFRRSIVRDGLCGVGGGGVRITGGTYVTNSIPSLAVNPVTGVAVIAAPENYITHEAVVVWASSDGGRTWEEREPVGGEAAQMYEFPWLAYGRDGVLHIAYLKEGPGGIYDAFMVSSPDDGMTWNEPRRLSSLPSFGNRHPTPGPDGFYGIGHYIGLDIGADNVAHPVWPDVRYPQVNVWTRAVPLDG